MKMTKCFIALLLLLTSHCAFAQLHVLACEPEWAALAKTLGGQHVKVHSATTALQDPHHIQARPSLIAKARRADLVICSGSELEIGWLPVLLRKSGNRKIQPGNPGLFYATDHVELLDKPLTVDRSEGDVHGAGNPHIHTNPDNMLKVSMALRDVLTQIDPQHAQDFQQNQTAFSERLEQALALWAEKIQTIKGKRVVVHHNTWVYLRQWLGLKKIATLEPKSGIPPTSRHLSKLVSQLKTQPADMIIYASYQDERASQWLSNKTGIPKVPLLYTVPDWEKDNALIDWYENMLNRLQAKE